MKILINRAYKVLYNKLPCHQVVASGMKPESLASFDNISELPECHQISIRIYCILYS